MGIIAHEWNALGPLLVMFLQGSLWHVVADDALDTSSALLLLARRMPRAPLTASPEAPHCVPRRRSLRP